MNSEKGLPPIAPAALQQGGFVAKAMNKVAFVFMPIVIHNFA